MSIVKIQLPSERPEVELLLCCARISIDAETAERIKTLLKTEIDWTYLMEVASRRGLIPLLWQSLETTSPEAVPKPFLDQLRNQFHNNAQRNHFLTDALLDLLHLLEGQAIAAIPYKGPALAATVYGNVALRRFRDLDILVQTRDLLRAKQLLLSDGYRLQKQMTSVEEAVYLESDYEYRFVRDEIIVGLHWRITPSDFYFPLNFSGLWERRQSVMLGDKMVFVPSHEDMLLLLCVHGAKDLWERLKWICDVATLVGMPQGVNWKWVLKQAHVLGSERMLFLGLRLAHDLVGAILPVEVLKRMQADPLVESLAGEVRGRLFAEVDNPPSDDERFVFYLSVREQLQDRMRYLRSLAWHYRWMTPQTIDRALLQLPNVLSFLYYMLWPLKLVGKSGLSPCRHLLRRLWGETRTRSLRK